MPNCRLWYRRPRAVDKPAWATVWVAWRGVGVVPVVSVWQSVAEHSVSCSAAARRPSSTSSAQCRKAQYWVRCCSSFTQHSGPCSYSGGGRRISTRICRRHAAVFICCRVRQMAQLERTWSCKRACSINGAHHTLSPKLQTVPDLVMGTREYAPRDSHHLGIHTSSTAYFWHL